MNAKEARAKSLENQMTREEALKEIKLQAEIGFTSCILCFGKNLSYSAAMELMKDGYKISKHIDSINGREFYKADW